MDSDFINTDFVYRKNTLIDKNLRSHSVKLNFRTRIKPNNLKIMLYGMCQPLAVHLIATILGNKHNIEFEKNNTLVKSNYFGSLSQCQSINIGSSENSTDIYCTLKQLAPFFDPNNIQMSGWDSSPFSFSKLGNKSLEEKLSPFEKQIIPLSFDNFNQIRHQIESFKQDDFLFVINCSGESTVSTLETLRSKIEDSTASKYEMVLLAAMLEKCHVLNFQSPLYEEFKNRDLYFLLSKLNTFVYNFTNDALKTEISNEFYETESNKILFGDSKPNMVPDSEPGIIETVLSGSMNSKIIQKKSVIIENKFDFMVPNIIDILVFCEFLSRVEYYIESKNKVEEFKKFDPLMSCLNYFVENQTILHGYKIKSNSSKCLTDTILTILGLEPSTELMFENICS